MKLSDEKRIVGVVEVAPRAGALKRVDFLLHGFPVGVAPRAGMNREYCLRCARRENRGLIEAANPPIPPFVKDGRPLGAWERADT